MTLDAGTKLGRYEIRQHLGAGGMGEVYLAQDTKLGRRVALKILPAEVAADQKRMQRFIQEAQAASALNHPNIITIHEIEETDATPFIATEFIDGETLRQRMSRARLTIAESLDICIQVASALSAAHASGIIHRDIKPENIMLRRDGIVKVLDFGLAKLTELQSSSVDMEAPTKAIVNTEPGTVMGTAHYMSPEQARGLETDARTDIWSLGVVLYEMVTGHQPFAGETTTDVLASIVKGQPMPLTRYATDAPAKLEEIVSKALEKDREERYQGIKDLLVDLRRLKKRMEFDAEVERSAAPDSISAQTVITDRAPSAAGMKSQTAAPTETAQTARPTSSAEYLVSGIRQHKIGFVVALSVFALLIAAGIFGLSKFASQRPPTTQSKQANAPVFQAMKITKLTDTGKTGNAAISPDGKYVVHVQVDGTKQSLWMRHVATDSNVRIIAPAEVDYWKMSFSHDGDFIYFVRYDKTELNGALYRIPVLGGEPVKVLSNIASSATLSPDGKQVAFRRIFKEGVDSAIIVANADGTNQRELVHPNPSGDNLLEADVAWSPDGKRIASSLISFQQGRKYLVEISVEDGSIKPINQDNWRDFGRLAWLPDGSGLLALAQAKGSQNQQIYLFSYPGGEARRITNDTNYYSDLSLSADASTLVTTQKTTDLNIWTLPLSGGAAQNSEPQARPLTDSGNHLNGNDGLDVSHDGKIVYTSSINGNSVLWICNADGTNPKRLDEEAYLFGPEISPDGRFIIVSIGGKNGDLTNIWRMNADGSNLVKLTNGEADEGSSITPDGRWVVYGNYDATKASVKKIPIEGGEAVSVIDKRFEVPRVSPDGKWMLGWYRENENENYRYAISPFDDAGGEQTIKPLDIPTPAWATWTPDGRAIAYTTYDDNRMSIWTLPLAGGKPQQLTNFKSQFIADFAFAPDGKSIVLSRGTETNDVVLISNFK